jgi:hypothetical protein
MRPNSNVTYENHASSTSTEHYLKIIAEPDANLAKLAKEEEELLKSLADPFLPKVFQFPELKGITLIYKDSEFNTKGYEITFLSEEDANVFKSRLSQKCLSDGKKVSKDFRIVTLAENKKILTLSFPSGNTENIKKLCDRLKDSQSVYESNKAFEAKLDTRIKKTAALALNIGGILPIIPIISWGLGKTFQASHLYFGLGSTAARTFLQIAKFGLENSHLYSIEEGSTLSWQLTNTNKSLDEINTREKKLAKSTDSFAIFFRYSSIITGAAGALLNFSSIVFNAFGDLLINTLAENANNSARKPSSLASSDPLTKGFYYCLNGLSKGCLYGLAGVASTVGLPFRATGMLLRSAGSILSTDAILLADAKNNPKLSSISKEFRKFDNFTIDSRFWIEKMMQKKQEPLGNTQKILAKVEVNVAQEEGLKEIQETAFKLFKELKGPSFQLSGIANDKNQYCEVATIKQKGNSYKLLYSPTTNHISIVDPQEDLNYAEETNKWNSDIEETDRADFTKLVSSLTNPKIKINPNQGTITKAPGHDSGLSFEAFKKKKSEATAAKKGQAGEHKIDGSEFKHNYSQYQYRENDDGTKTLYRKGAIRQNPVEISELEEFKIINDLYKKYGKEILEGEKPSTIVNYPLAQTLKAIKTVQDNSYFYH